MDCWLGFLSSLDNLWCEGGGRLKNMCRNTSPTSKIQVGVYIYVADNGFGGGVWIWIPAVQYPPNNIRMLFGGYRITSGCYAIRVYVHIWI